MLNSVGKFKISLEAHGRKLFEVFSAKEHASTKDRQNISRHYSLPVYQPGEIVSGDLDLDVEGDIHIDHVTVRFHSVTEVVGKNLNELKEIHINKHKVVWKKNETDKKCLQSGQYKFPFKFTLPSVTPPSFVFQNKDISITTFYKIEAWMEAVKPEHHKPRRIRSLRDTKLQYHFSEIWVKESIFLNMEPMAFMSLSKSIQKHIGSFTRRGKVITSKVVLHKRAFLKGEDIKLDLVVSNHCKRRIHKLLIAITLILTVWTDPIRMKKRVYEIQSSALNYASIESGESIEHKDVVLPFSFPRITNYPTSKLNIECLPVSMSKGRTLVDVAYVVRTSLFMGKMTRDIKFDVPFFVGNETHKSCEDPPIGDQRYQTRKQCDVIEDHAAIERDVDFRRLSIWKLLCFYFRLNKVLFWSFIQINTYILESCQGPGIWTCVWTHYNYFHKLCIYTVIWNNQTSPYPIENTHGNGNDFKVVCRLISVYTSSIPAGNAVLSLSSYFIFCG